MSTASEPHAEPLPAIRLEAWFMPFGDQIDIHLNGEEVLSSCRDYSRDHEVKDLEKEFLDRLVALIDEFRKR